MSVLENIHCHQDLQALSLQQQLQLCDEIRGFLVESVSKTGGHLASNLGVVELTVALETVYNTNIDRLVFDVGHQSYVHKLLSGRIRDFSTLRQYGGLAGFPKPSESPADAFVAGHASSSVSIALGMARARTLSGADYRVVALIGDGAATGGMAYEAMNDAAVSGENLLIILNDNEMSISPNVGGFARHLKKLRLSANYLGLKHRYRSRMSRNRLRRNLYKMTHRIKDRLKRLLLPTTIFENMGLTYLGPADGNDLQEMLRLLRAAKEMEGPVLLHVHTQKGRGFLPAQEDPSKFHGVGKFDPITGETPSGSPNFSQNFGETMLKLGKEVPNLCAITAAMPDGTGLLEFMKTFPERIFDVGIAEEHAVSMAGGLAKQGMIPVVALYSTFLQRGFDQIMQDIGLLRLHVVLAVDRAGLVGADGETHHGVFDVGFLRMIPQMTVLCPASLAEQTDMLRWAVKNCDGPVAVRYPRGGNRRLTASAWKNENSIREKGLLTCHKTGSDVALVSYGVCVENVLKASEILEKSGISAAVFRLLTVAPLPVEALVGSLGACRKLMIVEETCTAAGIKETLAWEVQKRLPDCCIFGIDLGDRYAPHGDMASLYRHCGLDELSVAEKTKEVFGFEK